MHNRIKGKGRSDEGRRLRKNTLDGKGRRKGVKKEG